MFGGGADKVSQLGRKAWMDIGLPPGERDRRYLVYGASARLSERALKAILRGLTFCVILRKGLCGFLLSFQVRANNHVFDSTFDADQFSQDFVHRPDIDSEDATAVSLVCLAYTMPSTYFCHSLYTTHPTSSRLPP